MHLSHKTNERSYFWEMVFHKSFDVEITVLFETTVGKYNSAQMLSGIQIYLNDRDPFSYLDVSSAQDFNRVLVFT